MEIDIQSKTNNPLLKRTEVHFCLKHDSEGTPKRELVRSELADKLKVKKENIMINYMKSNFGKTETLGYARVYTSVEAAKSGEKDYILKRNNVIVKEKKPEKGEKKEEKPEEKPPSKPEETPKEVEAEETEKPEEKKEETTEVKQEEQSVKPEEEKVEDEKQPEKKD